MATSRLSTPPTSVAARYRGHPTLALTVIAACQLMIILDATIVNIALPRIQSALSFSTTDLSWVLNAYTLTFGGLLLLGGRIGDVLGRRRVLVCGVALFTVASVIGGFSQQPWQLLVARSLQGASGAVLSPTALALVSSTFPEGPARNRALGVFAAVSAGGGAVGLLAGGMLTQWLAWRWVFFVNVPIGLLVAALAPFFLEESQRYPGRFDIAGAVLSTGGMVSLAYGFIRAADRGWTDGLVYGSFGTAVILLAAFVLNEQRAREPIIPLHMFADRNRRGTYAIMLCLSAAMFGMFFFLVLFAQNVLHYSPLSSGFAFLPVSVAILAGAGLATRFVPRFGAQPFLIGGTVLAGAGMLWLSGIGSNSSYAGGVLGPLLVFGVGTGLSFVTLTLTAVSGIAPQEAGAASGLLNIAQQTGGSLGLSILINVYGGVSHHEARARLPAFLAEASTGQKAAFAKNHMLPAPWSSEVLVRSISVAFLAGAAIMALALVTAVLVIRVRERDPETSRHQPAMSAPSHHTR